MIRSPTESSRTKSASQPRQSYWAPRPSKHTSAAKGKGKEKANESQAPSDAVIATWRKGDDDLEPSTKMLALIDLLQEWDDSGDKTIVYSQCQSDNQLPYSYPELTSFGPRDFDARPRRHSVLETWDPQPKV